MSTSLQQAIDRANKKAAISTRKVFGKKASDQQHHDNLLKHTDVLMDALDRDIKGGMTVSNNLREAVRELNMAMTLSRKSLSK